MNLNRRCFFKQLGFVSIFLVSMGPTALLTGCNALTDIANWVSVGLSAFQNIIGLLEGTGVINVAAGGEIASIVGIIDTGFTDLRAAIQQYKSTTPAPAGALAKVDAILSLVVTDFQSFMSSLNFNDPSVEKLVTSLAEILLSTLGGFESELPASAAVAQTSFRVGSRELMVKPKHRTRHQFIRDWNHQVSSGGHPELKLPWVVVQGPF